MSQTIDLTDDGRVIAWMAMKLLLPNSEPFLYLNSEVCSQPSHLYLGAVRVHIQPGETHCAGDFALYNTTDHEWRELWRHLCASGMDGKLYSGYGKLDWRLDYGIDSYSSLIVCRVRTNTVTVPLSERIECDPSFVPGMDYRCPACQEFIREHGNLEANAGSSTAGPSDAGPSNA